MFDTHCHLNFKAFDGRVEEVVDRARKAGVNYFVVPGTDVGTSKKAVAIAEKFDRAYAAVGIHPHHIFKFRIKNSELRIKEELKQIEQLIGHPKVVAVGEVGVDRHVYKKTVYQVYQVGRDFIELQKLFFSEQIKLAYKYKKALIIHNREAGKEVLEILSTNQQLTINNSIVFHCCEPDGELLEFAKKHKIYIGVDGDVTYQKEKQNFVKKIPLELLVLETDSPFLLPRPLTSEINEPKNLDIIASFIANIVGIAKNKLIKITEENSKKLFQIDLKA